MTEGFWHFLGRQLLVFAAATCTGTLWMVAVLSYFDLPSSITFTFGFLVASIVPVLSFLEATARRLLGKVYKMTLLETVGVSAFFVVVPSVVLVLYAIGECVRCVETSWDLSLGLLTVAFPLGIIQAASQRAFGRSK